MKNARFRKSKIKGRCWFNPDHKGEGLMTFHDGNEIISCKSCAKSNMYRIRRKRTSNNEGNVEKKA